MTGNKKVFILSACSVLLLLIGGCDFFVGKPYQFFEPIETIKRVDIVFAEDARNYTVLYTIPDDKKESFLKDFLEISFRSQFHNPSEVHLGAIRFEYASGNYEMHDGDWGSYVMRNGQSTKVSTNWDCCDGEQFEQIIERYMDNQYSILDKYPFSEDVSDIQRIELVYASDYKNCKVIAVVPDRLFALFLMELDNLDFQYDLFYHGTALKGRAVRITYRSGNYDILSNHSVDYVQVKVNGWQFDQRNKLLLCDEEKYKSFVEKWMSLSE